MKVKYRLKGWVVTCVYLISLGTIIGSFFTLGKILQSGFYSDDTLSYVYHGMLEDARPVVNYTSEEIIKPFDNEDVKIVKSYYDYKSDETSQENSLLFYKNTYMPNTGILYGSDKEFEITSVLDGTVESIVADEIMGNIVTIRHSNNLQTIYHSLNEVNVLIGDTVTQGDVLGTSGSNKIDSTNDNMLLFEVTLNGEYINPSEFFEMDINELS